MEKLEVLQSRLDPMKWLLKWILCFPKVAWRNQRAVNHSVFTSSSVLTMRWQGQRDVGRARGM